MTMLGCSKCGYQVEGVEGGGGPAACPRCRTWRSFEPVGFEAHAPGSWNPRLLSRIAAQKLVRKKFKQKAIDHLFGGGIVVGCSYLLSGAPGAGKSRWLLQLASFFTNPLYISAEESDAALKLRTIEMRVLLPNLRVVETRDMELVAKNITDEYDLVVVDSASRMKTSDTSAAIGSALQTNSVISLASDIAHKLKIPFIIVDHVNKQGEQSGMVANIHDVDGDLMIEKTGGTSRKITMSKNRHGPDPISVSCHMTAQGLDGFRVLSDDKESDHGMGQSVGPEEAGEEAA